MLRGLRTSGSWPAAGRVLVWVAIRGREMTSVLIVDDSRLGREIVGHLLTLLRPEWTVVAAPTVGAAREHLEASAPDVAIVAVPNPGDDELRLAEAMIARYPGVHVALLSAEPGPAHRHAASRLGCQFIPKPLTPEHLNRFVQSLPL